MSKNTIIGILFVACIILVGINLQTKEEKVRDRYQQEILTPPPSTQENNRGFDYQRGSWRNYSDEEIRMMREVHSYSSDGSYIHTPGRRVKTKKQEIEDMVQEYIDDNIDYILDNN